MASSAILSFEEGSDKVIFLERVPDDEIFHSSSEKLVEAITAEEKPHSFAQDDLLLRSSKDSENPLTNNSAEHDSLNTNDDDPPQSAFNPETGEINWDCPCLEKAIQPPCGEYFKAAFSCFVNSKTEPKGEECFEKFVAMNECFFAHPEVYAPDDNEELASAPDALS